MGGKSFFIALLLIIDFIGTLFIEMKLPKLYTLELVLILVGIIFGIIVLIGNSSKARWAPAMTVLFFGISLANSTLLFFIVPAVITFLGLVVVNCAGIIAGLVSEPQKEQEVPAQQFDSVPVETYSNANYTTPTVIAKKKR